MGYLVGGLFIIISLINIDNLNGEETLALLLAVMTVGFVTLYLMGKPK